MRQKYAFPLSIIILGLFLRLYNLGNTVNYGTDQAAALLIADIILNTGHVLLVGRLTTAWEFNLLPPNYY